MITHDGTNIQDPAHWRERAEEARTTGEGLTDPIAKKTMMEIAEGYELMAKRAETRRKI